MTLHLTVTPQELTGRFGAVSISRVGVAQVLPLQAIALKIYTETFAPFNTPENLKTYLNAAFSTEQLSQELADENNFFFMIEKEQRSIGYIKLEAGFDTTDSSIPPVVLEKNAVLLSRFYVDKPWHGTGIAEAMMQFCLDFSRSLNKNLLWLGVWGENHRAMAFYKKWGFEVAGGHIFLMGDDPQQDYWMVLSL